MAAAVADAIPFRYLFLDAEGYGDGKAGRYNAETREREPCRPVWPTIVDFIRVCGVRRFAHELTCRGGKCGTVQRRVGRWRRWLRPHLPAHTVSYGYRTAEPSAGDRGTQPMMLNIYTDDPAGTPTRYNVSRFAMRGGRRYAQRYGYGVRDFTVPVAGRCPKYVRHTAAA
jgi:hypothetical protein